MIISTKGGEGRHLEVGFTHTHSAVLSWVDSSRPVTVAQQAHYLWDSPGKNTGVGCLFLLQCMKVQSESKVAQLCLTICDPWTVAQQAPLSMRFSRQEYWSGLPFPSPGNLPNPGIEPRSPTLQADTLTSEPPGKPIIQLRPY